MERLDRTRLGALPDEVIRPGYDRDAVGIGIVHLGLGAFHRAHMAVYVDELLAMGAGDWAIAGVSLRSAGVHDALAPQDGLYTVVERGPEGPRCRVIGSVKQVLVAPASPEAVLEQMESPATRIVSLTVTEKGYCHSPATGALDETHPDILHDLGDLDAPKSAIGFLVSALDRRRRADRPPFTVLSCDNLPSNGDTARGIVQRFADLVDPALGRWVEDHVAFPNTMVDRIVPATTDADRDAVAAALGCRDAWPVVTEPFRQWVIEDRFCDGRPDWDAAGAQLAEDVAPFELMKLRLLNGAHSSLAYLGYLAGYETVSDAMADPNMAAFIRRLMDEEVTPTLTVPPGTDLAAYKDALIERFRNPALQHRTWQIAMDGSQKLPQRLLGTVHDRLAAGQPIDGLALGIAAWMRYVTGADEQGNPIDVRDPLADQLRDRARQAGDGDAAALAASLLQLEAVFGTDLPATDTFVGPVTAALSSLLSGGAKAALQAPPRH